MAYHEGSSSAKRRMSVRDEAEDNDVVLYLKETHRANFIYEDKVGSTTPDSYFRCGKLWPLDPRTEGFVDQAGFLHAARTSRLEVDTGLMHALAERWRPETHSFHLPTGEMTITLRDVAMILGLRIDGPPISDQYMEGETIGSDVEPTTYWKTHTLDIFENMFGVRPSRENLCKGTTDFYVSWLKEHILKKPDDGAWRTNSDVVAEKRAKAYILCLLGSVLFANSNNSLVPLQYLNFIYDLDECSQYSWGSAVLSHLYRGLCRWTKNKKAFVISGCGVLLQVWCWMHLSLGRPTCLDPVVSGQTVGCWWSGHKSSKKSVQPRTRWFYRNHLKTLKKDAVTWNPWTEEIRSMMPPISLDGWDLVNIQLPLIHFNCVEFQLPNRVYRQLGFGYCIPEGMPERLEWETLHRNDQWTKISIPPWHVVHQRYIVMWNSRNDRENYPIPQPIEVTQRVYLKWFSRITVDLVDDKSAVQEEGEEVEAQRPLEARPSQGYYVEHSDIIRHMARGYVQMYKQARKLLHDNGPPRKRYQKLMDIATEGLKVSAQDDIINLIEDGEMSECSIEDDEHDAQVMDIPDTHPPPDTQLSQPGTRQAGPYVSLNLEL